MAQRFNVEDTYPRQDRFVFPYKKLLVSAGGKSLPFHEDGVSGLCHNAALHLVWPRTVLYSIVLSPQEMGLFAGTESHAASCHASAEPASPSPSHKGVKPMPAGKAGPPGSQGRPIPMPRLQGLHTMYRIQTKGTAKGRVTMPVSETAELYHVLPPN